MKLVELKNWELHPMDELWGFTPFKKLLERDESEDKERVMKELLFIFHFCDVKSQYVIVSEKEREKEIKKDIGLPARWKPDKLVKDAMKFYEDNNDTVTTKLYKSAVKSATAISEYLEDTKKLLNEGKVDISKISSALKSIPKLMDDLDSAYKKVVKEREETNRHKGSQSFNVFEDGISFE